MKVQAALDDRRDSDVNTLLSRRPVAVDFFYSVVFWRLAGKFLLHHAERDNRHLFYAFSTDVRQRPDLLRQDGPLERQLVWVPSADRPAIVDFVRWAVPPPHSHGQGRSSRARYRPPDRWTAHGIKQQCSWTFPCLSTSRHFSFPSPLTLCATYSPVANSLRSPLTLRAASNSSCCTCPLSRTLRACHSPPIVFPSSCNWLSVPVLTYGPKGSLN